MYDNQEQEGQERHYPILIRLEIRLKWVSSLAFVLLIAKMDFSFLVEQGGKNQSASTTLLQKAKKLAWPFV